MIKTIIVEDEIFLRKGLINSIDWLSKDCYIVGEAENGEEGLNLISQLSPDLVISDIKIPVFSGLEMLKKAKEKGLDFEIILLTSYSDFEFAKTGIELEVVEYLLKPLDEELLYIALDKVKKKIEDKKIINLYEKNLKDIDVIKIDFNKIKNRYVNMTLEKINKNYYGRLNLKCIADELEVSVGYLSRKIKEELGETFVDILNKYRIQKSIHYLLENKYKIYEISDKVGFTEYKHFHNTFKKYLGIAPSEFGKELIEK